MAGQQRIGLVTGANRDLGFEVWRQLGAEGCHVLLGARDSATGQAAAEALRLEGHGITLATLDLAEPASIKAVANYIGKVHAQLDFLINNAAILSDTNQHPTAVSDATLRENFEINFFRPWQLTRAPSPLLKARAGRVLNIATQVARLSQLTDLTSPLKAAIYPVYQASKVAISAMTVLFAKELRDSGVRVNSVCPGWVHTDMGHEDLPDYGDAARPMSPAEAVAAYLWLLSPDEKVSTGGFFTGRERVGW